jgi:hypothetical protein
MAQCKIVVRYKYTPAHVADKTPRIDEADFNSIANLSNYLRWEPERAAQLGYGKGPMPHYNLLSKSEDVKLIIYFKDEHEDITAEFASAHAFARFLDRNPAIAACVGYKSKSENQ